MAIKRKRRPISARVIKAPLAVKSKADIVRLLTREVRRIANHLGGNPRHWRDVRTRMSLERKINERAEVLETLRTENPEIYQELLVEMRR